MHLRTHRRERCILITLCACKLLLCADFRLQLLFPVLLRFVDHVLIIVIRQQRQRCRWERMFLCVSGST